MTNAYKRKIIKTVAISMSLLCAVSLVFIGGPSLSSFHGSDYEPIYIAMHGFAIMFFCWNAVEKDVGTEYFLPFGMLSIVAFSMWEWDTMHTIATIITILVALFTIQYNVQPSLKVWNRWYLVLGAIVVFALGYFTNFVGFAFAETFVMGVVASAKLKEIHG